MNFLNGVHLYVTGTFFTNKLILVKSFIQKPLRSMAPKCGLSLIHVSRKCTELYLYFSIYGHFSICKKIRIRFCPKASIFVYFKQCNQSSNGIFYLKNSSSTVLFPNISLKHLSNFWHFQILQRIFKGPKREGISFQ